MKPTLALYPEARGLGYACVVMPEKLKDYGIITWKPFSNRRILKYIERFIDFHRPQLVLLRDQTPNTTEWVTKLVDAISTLAKEYNLSVHHYSREQIKEVFALFGAQTKYEIAEHIVKGFPALAGQVPQQGSFARGDGYQMGIFNSVALAITHAYLST